MMDSGFKDDLHSYLRGARRTMLGKLDGLSEYDYAARSRRPAPTCSAW